jgi:hypothetical protein
MLPTVIWDKEFFNLKKYVTFITFVVNNIVHPNDLQ